jgi:PAS domain S-box-containing protein
MLRFGARPSVLFLTWSGLPTTSTQQCPQPVDGSLRLGLCLEVVFDPRWIAPRLGFEIDRDHAGFEPAGSDMLFGVLLSADDGRQSEIPDGRGAVMQHNRPLPAARWIICVKALPFLEHRARRRTTNPPMHWKRGAVSVIDFLSNAILSTRSDAIVAADRDGTIQFWNAGAERIFGHTASEAVGRSLDVIIPDRLRNRHWDGYRQNMKTGESRYGEGDVLAVPALRKDGRSISIEFTIMPVKDESGRIIGMGAIIRDVTKRFDEMRALKRRLAEVANAGTKAWRGNPSAIWSLIGCAGRRG